jgi:hypothetical protein
LANEQDFIEPKLTFELSDAEIDELEQKITKSLFEFHFMLYDLGFARLRSYSTTLPATDTFKLFLI